MEHGGAWLRNTGSPAGFKPKAVPEPSRIQAQGGARSVRRDAFETASSELLNTIQGNTKQIYKAYNTRQYFESKYTRHTRHRRQSHRCLDEPEYWKSPVEHGGAAKHRIPSRIQAQGGARSVRRDALEIASSEPLNTRQYKANLQGIQGIEGKAIDVWMNRNTVFRKSAVEHGGAWLRNTGSPAGFKPKAVPEACAEMLSKQHLRNC